MADTKISALSAGTAAPGDEIPVNRGGSNFKITAGDILKINGGTITADSPVLNLTQTWNNAAVTFVGMKFNATDTTSASGSLLMDLQVGTVSQFNVKKNGQLTTSYSGVSSVSGTGIPSIGIAGTQQGILATSGGVALMWGGVTTASFRSNEVRITSTIPFGFASGDPTLTGLDVALARDAADTFAQRRSTNAQTFRIYNTFTDASNYERGKFSWSSNVLQIGTEKAGTGTARALELQTDGTTRLTIGTTGNVTMSGVRLFLSSANTGISWVTGNSLALHTGGASAVGFLSNNVGFIIPKNYYFGWSDTDSNANTPIDTAIVRSSAAKVVITNGSTGAGSLVFRDDGNIEAGTTTGTKIGTGTTQKLAFWNATPVVQPVNSTAIDTLLVDTGLRASGGTANFATAIETSSTIKTGAPTGGTAAAWKLGTVASVSPTSPNRTIEVDIGGTIYYLHAKTTND